MKKLVKMKWQDGSTTYVNPEDVRSLRPTHHGPGLTVIVYDAGRGVCEMVQGTPEEVHAQLFPESEPGVVLDFSGNYSERSNVTIPRTNNISLALEVVFKSLVEQRTLWRALQVARDFGRAEGNSRITMESFLALCANAFVDVTFTE